MNTTELTEMGVATQAYLDRKVEFYSMRDLRAAIEKEKMSMEEASQSFHELSKKHTELIRLTRMTTTAEVAAMISSLRDIRSFLLEDEHVEQITRLKEFVDLCERVKALQESGTLDRVASVIERLIK